MPEEAPTSLFEPTADTQSTYETSERARNPGNGGETHQAPGQRRRSDDHGPGCPGLRQPELAARGRARPDAARGFRLSREDLPLRPRAHPRARRPRPRLRRPRLLRGHRRSLGPHHGRALPEERQAHARLRALLHRRRQQGLGRPGARRPRLRGQALHRGRQLGHRRQQHPGLLHPGRDEVPRPGPRGEGRARPRLPAGRLRPRQFLGLRLADARVAPHDHVDDVRPRHPPLLPLHGRLRRPHLPPRKCRRRSRISSSSTGSRSSACSRWSGTRR